MKLPTLTPVDISHGKGLEFVHGIVDQGSTNFGRLQQEVKKKQSLLQWQVKKYEIACSWIGNFNVKRGKWNH